MVMPGGEERKRKVRADKKKAIAPYIPDNYRVWIHRVARMCELPEGEVGLQLIRTVLLDEVCIRFFCSYYKRDYRYSDKLTFIGHSDACSIYDYIEITGECARFKVKPSQMLYNQLCEFQIALGISYLSHATYALLHYALHDLHSLQKVCPHIQLSDLKAPAQLSSGRSSSNVWSILK